MAVSESRERPRVLLTRAEEVIGERWEDYADCVREAGAEPVAIDLEDWQRNGMPPDYDGLLVTAGVDVDPSRYNEERSEFVREVMPERDAFEAAVIEDALERDVPVLAICRGHQIFNVAAGGSLLQHIAEREPHRARRGEGDAIDSGWHEIEIAPESRIAAALGRTRVRVNSRHHQAVTAERVAPGLDVTATTDDGVVEGLEVPGKRWAVSVQWHPERDEMLPDQRPLFDAFVEACREAADEA